MKKFRLAKKEWRAIMVASQKQAAKPIIHRARQNLTRSTVFRNLGTDRGYSKLVHVGKSIHSKALTGPVTMVQVDYKAPDVEVKGSKRPKWTAHGWAMLLAKGRKWTSRGARTSHYTGTTMGAGDYVVNAGNEMRSQASGIYKKKMISRIGAFKRRMFKGGLA